MTAGLSLRSSYTRRGSGRVTTSVAPPLNRTRMIMSFLLVRVTSSSSKRAMRLRSRSGVFGSCQSRGKCQDALALLRIDAGGVDLALVFVLLFGVGQRTQLAVPVGLQRARHQAVVWI